MPADTESQILLSPNLDTGTELFQYSFSELACNTQSDNDVLRRLEVRCIMHNKLPDGPQHEFLVIETVDRFERDKVRLFILERTMSSQDTVIDSVRDPSDRKLHTRIATACSPLSADSNSSSKPEEEQPNRHTGTLTIADKLTVASTQSADIISDALSNAQKYPAKDRFLGGNAIRLKRWHKEIVNYFKPKGLTLFQLAIIADCTHELYPDYSIFSHQCYFYAGVVYGAAEECFGMLPSKNADESQGNLVHIIDSHLSDKYGRWNGVKVTMGPSDLEAVSAVVALYKLRYDEKMLHVSNLKNIQKTIIL